MQGTWWKLFNICYLIVHSWYVILVNCINIYVFGKGIRWLKYYLDQLKEIAICGARGEISEMRIEFWPDNILEDLAVDGWIVLQFILKKYDGTVWPGFMSLSSGFSGGLLRIRQWTFLFHKRPEISIVDERLSALQDGQCVI